MNTLQTTSKEPKFMKDVVAGIYADMFIEATEWAASIDKKRAEVNNSIERLDKYISLGIIDEHTCIFASMKSFFQSVNHDFDELNKDILVYVKEVIKLLHTEKYELQRYTFDEQHRKLGRETSNLILEVNRRLEEFNRIIRAVGFTPNEVYYSVEF
jgi:hypothetical protein